MNADSHQSDRHALPDVTLLLLLVAAFGVYLLGAIPGLGWISYGLRLFATFIHETGHALMGLCTGGDVHSLEVHWNTGGLTRVRGGITALTASAGYLGTALFGALMILSARTTQSARIALGITGATVLLVTLFFAGSLATSWPAITGFIVALLSIAACFHPKTQGTPRLILLGFAGLNIVGSTVYLMASSTLLTWALGISSGLLLLLAALFTAGDVSKLLAAFLGIHIGLDALSDTVNLIGLSLYPTCHTDAVIIARELGMPPLVWAVLWSLLSIAAVTGSLGFLYWEYKRHQNDQKLLPTL